MKQTIFSFTAQGGQATSLIDVWGDYAAVRFVNLILLTLITGLVACGGSSGIGGSHLGITQLN
jgi:Na+/serine symporter